MSIELKKVTTLAHLNSSKISSLSKKDIVLDAIFSCSGKVEIEKLSSIITTIFGVNMPQDILDEIVDTLKKDSMLFQEKEILSIPGLHYAEIVKKRNKDILISQKAIEKWLNNKELFPCLDEKDKELLSKAVDIFLNYIFVRHGVSSYKYMNHSNIDETAFDIENISDEVSYLYSEERNSFFRKSLPTIFTIVDDLDIIEYLNIKRLKAISYLSSAMPKEQYDQLLLRMKDIVVYLDTSVIYRLLNLQGETRYKAVKEVIEFCRRHGVIFKVNAETYKELISRIDFDSRVITQFPVKVNLYACGYNYRSSDNYVSSYWKKASETGVSVQDFNAFYKNSDALLQDKYGIEIEEISIEEESFLDKVRLIYSKLCLLDADGEKNPKAIWHDAYSIAYVRKQQKSNALNAIDTKCLFMTSDRMLLQLQDNDYELRRSNQFVIRPSELLQLFSFTTVEGDYIKTYAKLFSSASIGYNTKLYSNNDIQEILSRISHYDDVPDKVAERVLENMLLDNKIQKLDNEEEKEEIIYKEISEELQIEIRNKQGENEELLKKEVQLKKQYDSLKDVLKNSEVLLQQIQADNSKKDITIKRYEEKFLADENDKVNKKWILWNWGHIGCIAFGAMLILSSIVVSIFVLLHNIDADQLSWLSIGIGLIIDVFVLGFGIPLFTFGLKIKKPNIEEEIKEAYRKEIQAKNRTNKLIYTDLCDSATRDI